MTKVGDVEGVGSAHAIAVEHASKHSVTKVFIRVKTLALTMY